MEKGMEKGREYAAKNALLAGASVEFVSKITGLPMSAIKQLRQEIDV